MRQVDAKPLTIEILDAEHQIWLTKYKRGRNEQGLRFGQYMWNYYDLDKLFGYGPNNKRDGHHDGFATEDPNVAYSIFITKLVEQLNAK